MRLNIHARKSIVPFCHLDFLRAHSRFQWREGRGVELKSKVYVSLWGRPDRGVFFFGRFFWVEGTVLTNLIDRLLSIN